MDIGTKIYKPVEDEIYMEAAKYCTQKQDRILKDMGDYYEIVPYVKEITVDDYDFAMEEHLRKEREARGYTVREPSDYKGSSVARWAQDAEDWIAHRDEVMMYGLNVMNSYSETGNIPDIEEFKQNLPKIVWTYEGD